MFKIGTALVTGVLAAFLTVLTAVSAGARFSTAAGRSIAVLLVVAALVFLAAFVLEKQFPALFARASSRMSVESAALRHRSARRMSMFARIWALTAPEGRWVAASFPKIA